MKAIENRTELTKYCYHSTCTREWLDHLSRSHFSEHPLTIEEVDDAILLPDSGKLECFSGGIVNAKREPVVKSFQRNGLKTVEKLISFTDFGVIPYINKKVYYIGQYRNHWGSFLVDTIPRLWHAIDSPEKYTFAILGTQTDLGGIHDNVYEFFELFGIRREQILYIDRPTQFKQVIIPDLSYVPLDSWYSEYRAIIRKVVRHSLVSDFRCSEKIYFSRSRFSKESKTDFGEDLLVDIMKANGFQIVYPEDCSLKEQINYVNHCKVFATVGGSCAHNIIFAQKPPKMILFNRMNGYQWHQWMLDEMAEVEPITYVDAYWEPYKLIYKTGIDGPFLYWINKNTKRFFADNGYTYPSSIARIISQFGVFFRYSLSTVHHIGALFKKKFILSGGKLK